MDVQSCKATYLELSGQIFQQRSGWNPFAKLITIIGKWPYAMMGKSWFSGDTLKEAMQEVIEESDPNLLSSGTTPAESELLYDGDSLQSKRFVCAIRDADSECVRLRTYATGSMKNPPPKDDRYPARCKIWQAGRATSVAPLSFPHMQIDNVEFFDGGTQSNNPILEIADEAIQIYGEDAVIQAIVSIGTGASQSLAPAGDLLSFVSNLMSKVTDTESKHEDFLKKKGSPMEAYYQFQAPYSTDLGSIDLVALDKLVWIERLANEYAESEEGKGMIENCAKRLCRI